MAQTIADLVITNSWQSINTLTGISVGDAMTIDNKSTSLVLLAEGTQPSASSKDGVPLTTYRGTNSTKIIPSGSLEIWARIEAESSEVRITVQAG